MLRGNQSNDDEVSSSSNNNPSSRKGANQSQSLNSFSQNQLPVSHQSIMQQLQLGGPSAHHQAATTTGTSTPSSLLSNLLSGGNDIYVEELRRRLIAQSEVEIERKNLLHRLMNGGGITDRLAAASSITENEESLRRQLDQELLLRDTSTLNSLAAAGFPSAAAAAFPNPHLDAFAYQNPSLFSALNRGSSMLDHSLQRSLYDQLSAARMAANASSLEQIMPPITPTTNGGGPAPNGALSPLKRKLSCRNSNTEQEEADKSQSLPNKKPKALEDAGNEKTDESSAVLVPPLSKEIDKTKTNSSESLNSDTTAAATTGTMKNSKKNMFLRRHMESTNRVNGHITSTSKDNESQDHPKENGLSKTNPENTDSNDERIPQHYKPESTKKQTKDSDTPRYPSYALKWYEIKNKIDKKYPQMEKEKRMKVVREVFMDCLNSGEVLILSEGIGWSRGYNVSGIREDTIPLR